jgi:hypothetical protein
MRAGETRLIVLNYAPWTIPIMANGGPGLVPTPQVSIAEDSESCHNDAIDGFAPPTTLGSFFVTNLDLEAATALTMDLGSDVAPAGNTFEFKLHPVSGPYHGSLTATPETGEWVYMPEANFTGYDQFWVEIVDGQGRKIIRPVNINVGGAEGNPPPYWGESKAMGLQIDRSKMRVNQTTQTVTFPAHMPPSNSADTIDACRRYKATVKAFARDCETEFSHITCIEVTSQRC